VDKEMWIDVYRRLSGAVRRQRPEKLELIFDFSFMKMLQHTYRFWSRIS